MLLKYLDRKKRHCVIAGKTSVRKEYRPKDYYMTEGEGGVASTEVN